MIVLYLLNSIVSDIREKMRVKNLGSISLCTQKLSKYHEDRMS